MLQAPVNAVGSNIRLTAPTGTATSAGMTPAYQRAPITIGNRPRATRSHRPTFRVVFILMSVSLIVMALSFIGR